jgi:hypothetical protein
VLETRPTSSSVGADARRDMHSDAADVVVAAFNLSGVNDGAHVEAHGSRRHVGARRDEGGLRARHRHGPTNASV